MADRQDDIEFLKSYLTELCVDRADRAEPDYFETTSAPSDPAQFFTTWNEKAERAARLADEYGEDGSVLRAYLERDYNWNPLSPEAREELARQIQLIPRIIAKMEKSDTVAETLPDDTVLSPRQIADTFKVPREPLRKALERWRKHDRTCFIENSDRTQTEAKFLYRLRAVRDIIDRLKASSMRPPQK